MNLAAPTGLLAQMSASSKRIAAMASASSGPGLKQKAPLRYRGFVLIPQTDLTWVVRPERSPLELMPFRAPASSIEDVKALIDWRLNQAA